MGLGLANLPLGRFETAEKALREAIRSKPDLVEAYSPLAALLARQQKFAEADELMKASVKAAPNSASAHNMLATYLNQREKGAEAEAELREALRIEPNNAPALNNLGYYMVEHDRNLTEALNLIQRAVDADPGNPSFLDSLGWAHFKLNHLEEAEKYLTLAANTARSASMVEHLGDLYDRIGKKEAAQREWQRALSLPATAAQTARLKSKLGIESNK